jgi:hypothetical protein
MRVSKQNPCPACGKPDYCLIFDDIAICMRSSSDRPHTFKDGSQGWIHKLGGEHPKPVIHREKPAPVIDAEAMMRRWLTETRADWIARLATNLGVSGASLLELRAAWAPEHKAWAFPMRSGATGMAVGIRLRSENGEKWAVKGSKQGLFLPYMTVQPTAYIVEGPTDCAAGLTLGLFTIGRPSCSGGSSDLATALPRLKISRLVIIADNDPDKELVGHKYNPGLDGAQRLAEVIGVPCVTVILPTKDIREFVKLGGTAEDLENIVNQCVWKV